MQILKKTILATLFVLLAQLVISAQSNAKDRVLTHVPWAKSPVDVTAIVTDIGPIQSGKNFSAPDFWLRGLTLRVKNLSDKPIVGARYALMLPNIPGRSNPIGTWLEYGQGNGDKEQKAKPVAMRPGEEFNISLGIESYDDLALGLEENFSISIGHLAAARLILQEVNFKDGSRWVGGSFLSTPSENAPASTVDAQSPIFQPRIAFCGIIISSVEVLCCSNSKRGCHHLVVRVGRRNAFPSEVQNTVVVCAMDSLCRCGIRTICSTDVTIPCWGTPILDCNAA
jgi:hypothetical protein